MAGIAVGGIQSDKTSIQWNRIEDGKEEGIFVVEGGERLIIMKNEIYKNNNGIVLLRSDGIAQNNSIEKSENRGILIVNDSRPTVDNN